MTGLGAKGDEMASGSTFGEGDVESSVLIERQNQECAICFEVMKEIGVCIDSPADGEAKCCHSYCLECCRSLFARGDP